jgi:hypothetical protein
MPTTTERIRAEEEASTADVAAAILADLAGDEDLAMSLDLRGSRSSKRGEMGGLEFALTHAALYNVVKFLWAVTKFVPPLFRRSAELVPSPVDGSSGKCVLDFLRDEVAPLEIAAWPVGALRICSITTRKPSGQTNRPGFCSAYASQLACELPNTSYVSLDILHNLEPKRTGP